MGSFRILMIPSWYPTVKDKVSGSFFEEQAKLINQDHEVIVLYFERMPVRLWNWILLLLSNKVFSDFVKYEEGLPTIIYKSYEIQVPRSLNKLYFFRVLFSKFNTYLFFKTVTRADLLVEQIFQPQILHVQSLFGTGVAASILKQKYGCPLVITEHQVYKQSLVPDYLNKYFHLSVNNTDHVICVSTHLLRVMLTHNYISNFSIIGNPVNDQLFNIKNKSLLNNSKAVIEFISITYDSYIKDTMTLLRALNYCVLQGYKNLKLTLIINTFGQNNKIPDHWYEFIVQHKLLDYIKPCYNLRRDEIAEVIRSKDVYISTSLAETFGLAIAESLISGLYILSSKNGGSDDFLNNENSQRFEIGNYKMLAELMIRIMMGGITWNPFDQRDSVVRKVGYESYRSKMEQVYCSVLNTNNNKVDFSN